MAGGPGYTRGGEAGAALVAPLVGAPPLPAGPRGRVGSWREPLWGLAPGLGLAYRGAADE